MLKPCPLSPFGSDDRAFGTPGAGGNNAFVDPGTGLAFGYVTNKSGFFIADDPREYALRRRAYECVARLREAEGLAPVVGEACLQPGHLTAAWLKKHPEAALRG